MKLLQATGLEERFEERERQRDQINIQDISINSIDLANHCPPPTQPETEIDLETIDKIKNLTVKNVKKQKEEMVDDDLMKKRDQIINQLKLDLTKL